MDKWEMCIYDSVGRVIFYSPRDSSQLSEEKFIKKFIDSQFNSGWNSPPRSIIIQWLLDNGWEPYGHVSGGDYFRKKFELPK